MVNRPYMIDLYAGDDVVDAPHQPLAGFLQVKAQGIAFLDHKASQGETWQDPRVALRRQYWMTGNPVKVIDVDKAILEIAPKFGFYHFNGPMTNVAAEVANFLAVVNRLYEEGDDVCIDWEPIGTSGHQVSPTQIDEWCQRVEDKFGFGCKVYGGNVPREQFAKAGIPSALIDRFKARRLWYCEYNSAPKNLPLPWKDVGPYMWQDDGDQSGPGPNRIPGIERYCDNSTVFGDMTVARVSAGWGSQPQA
jgi:lysozyme